MPESFKSFLLGWSGATEKTPTTNPQSGGRGGGCRGKRTLGNSASTMPHLVPQENSTFSCACVLVNPCFTLCREETFSLWLGWQKSGFLVVIRGSGGIVASEAGFRVICFILASLYISASRAIWCHQFPSLRGILRCRKGQFLVFPAAGLRFNFLGSAKVFAFLFPYFYCYCFHSCSNYNDFMPLKNPFPVIFEGFGEGVHVDTCI